MSVLYMKTSYRPVPSRAQSNEFYSVEQTLLENGVCKLANAVICTYQYRKSFNIIVSNDYFRPYFKLKDKSLTFCFI